jgi:glycosyltransferase involved in cell wall biosynthesis
MASGKAVIAVDWGGPADYIDPSCGILIPPRDPDRLVADLEESIVALATDRTRCAMMGRAGRDKALRHYAWSVKISRLVDVYRMVSRHTGGQPVGGTRDGQLHLQQVPDAKLGQDDERRIA